MFLEVGCQIGYVNRIDFGADLSAARQMPCIDILHAFWQISGAGAQTTRHLVEVCDQRRGDRWSCCDQGLTLSTSPQINPILRA